jgi:hypothetical protein
MAKLKSAQPALSVETYCSRSSRSIDFYTESATVESQQKVELVVETSLASSSNAWTTTKIELSSLRF